MADQLGISQPSLSKQILSLEAELGIKLFDRNHSPMTVTPAGEFFIQEARELLYKEDQLVKGLDRFKSGENGRLVIGVTPFRSFYLMPRIVRKVKTRYPGVQVVLHEASSAQLRKEAAEGRYDFAVVNLPVDDSLLDAVAIEPDTLVLAVPNDMLDLLPAGTGSAIDFADARALPFVVLGQSQELRQLFDKLQSLVEISCIVGSDGKSAEMAAFLNHLCSLSPKLRLTMLAPRSQTSRPQNWEREISVVF